MILLFATYEKILLSTAIYFLFDRVPFPPIYTLPCYILLNITMKSCEFSYYMIIGIYQMQLMNYFVNALTNIINKVILMPRKTHMRWNNFDKQQMANRMNSKITHITLCVLLLLHNFLIFLFNIYIYKYLYFIVSIIVNI